MKATFTGIVLAQLTLLFLFYVLPAVAVIAVAWHFIAKFW